MPITQFPLVEIILGVTGFFVSRGIMGMDQSVKQLTEKLSTLTVNFASFASKTEALLEQHEKDIEDLKNKLKG